MPFGKSVFLGAVLAMSRIGEAKEFINNVYYCNEVTKMQYTNVGCSGTFSTPDSFIEGSCSATYTTHSYSGPLAPLNEQITFHLRGPLQLFKFAAYYIDNTPEEDEETYAKEKREPHIHHRRHHEHQHEKREKKGKGKVKTEVVEEVVTITKYVEPTSTSSALYDAASAVVANAYKAPKTSSNKPAKPENGDVWKKVGYYDAAKQISEGIMFLNNKGGQGSGTWTSCFGNSLSYMSADGKDGSSSPQTLADGVVFGVNEEFSIWTNQTCDGSCGYSYGQDVCYKGWDGDNKVFVFEFTMPTDTKNAGNIYGNSNMPAIWSLNSRIGRTLQYPADPKNSCWNSGCGEFDIWEVLYWDTPASQYMTSTLHSAQGSPGNTGKGGGGTCDYFKRPTDSTFIGMVSYLSDGTITIQKLDSFDYPEYITTDDIKEGWSSGIPTFPVNS
ncbi:hypothetical protein ABW19_dt0202190 [Dactylella cylindrospora]|nr:hypothetical protein ABW19_dt0202190 [Dactylella cylindrospora]